VSVRRSSNCDGVENLAGRSGLRIDALDPGVESAVPDMINMLNENHNADLGIMLQCSVVARLGHND
jgi:hypothetical protein